jgi:hypothetical protein
MAERTNGPERASIPCTPAVKAQLRDYKEALHSTLNRRATVGEIVGALLSGVPLWQADAMLSAYRPQQRDSTSADSEEAGDDSDG